MDRATFIKQLAKLNRRTVSVRNAVYDWAEANGYGHCKLSDVMRDAPAHLSEAYKNANEAAYLHARSGISLGLVYIIGNELRFTKGRGKSAREHCAEHYVG